MVDFNEREKEPLGTGEKLKRHVVFIESHQTRKIMIHFERQESTYLWLLLDQKSV